MRASNLYDSDYDPAAPVFPIGIGPSGEETVRRELIAFIDTGADVTMLPSDTLRGAGGRLVEEGRMRGITGEAEIVNLYSIAVHIAGITIHGIRAAAMKKNSEAILGRDVLNQLELTLNGPAQETWVA